MQANLGYLISQATRSKFEEQFRKKYKKPFNDKELYTVICSIGIIQKETSKFQLIALANGTKSLPYELSRIHKSTVLKDTHAQILCIKSFREWLTFKLLQKQSKYFYYNQKKQKYSFNLNRFQIFIYSTENFCGDCSIEEKTNQFTGAKPLKYFKEGLYPPDKFEINILRSKPGRCDLPFSKKSLCLSCSDKLALYNILGIQGKELFNYFTPLYIDRFYVDKSQNLKQRIQKGLDFGQRLKCLKEKDQKYIQLKLFFLKIDQQNVRITHQFYCHKPEIYCLSKIEENFQKVQREGMDLSFIWNQTCYEWVNGRTGLPQGSSLKNYQKKGKYSFFCKASLLDQLKKMNKPEIQQTFKYEAVKQRVKGLFGIWTDTFQVNKQLTNS